ncbi:hypothetical protein EIN_186090 [Entamoeba invadens IP1]|uniref:hypothetical protein n=1 Tax=Entamoeba invadens IP1 TaxID=370355 RepID=UPI0002C3D750|nr:hypothetical protein EIN_186090 [Entamoeba invadens IP1]ELP94192.1 hypothetical protein EIN_186090 [Entamoeba invadens IP1]|eukprot:XP_004260963.1 hypothetical protein EIN_186090 [Entamoeba invadens IP1]
MRKLDNYSILIVSQYFKTTEDFINIICVCKKFEETTLKYRYNPIELKVNQRLFPKLETWCIYNIQRKLEVPNTIGLARICFPATPSHKKEVLSVIKNAKFVYNTNAPSTGSMPNMKNLNMLSFHSLSKLVLQDVVIPPQIIKFESCCFESNRSIQHVTLLASVTVLPQSTFNDCMSLQQVVLPNYILSIGDKCFSNCPTLVDINIPTNLRSIGKSAFRKCKNLQNLLLPSSLTIINDFAFSLCTSLKDIQLQGDMAVIKNSSFFMCKSITSMQIPSSITLIENEAFRGCSSLTSINLERVVSIGRKAFSECNSLSEIYFPRALLSIGESGFSHCYNLSKLLCESTHIDMGRFCFYETKIKVDSSFLAVFHSC